MRSVALYVLLLGLLTIVGGIIGLAAADSWISLVSGLVGGAVFLGAGLSMQKGSRTGMNLALVFSLLLAIYGAQRWLTDNEFMPGGPIVILSVIGVVLIILLLVQPRERRRIF